MKKRLIELGIEAKASTPQEISARLKSDIDKWTPIIRKTGVYADVPLMFPTPDIKGKILALLSYITFLFGSGFPVGFRGDLANAQKAPDLIAQIGEGSIVQLGGGGT